MYDLNARYYDAKIARFLSPDPYYDLGNRVIGLYEINVPNAASIIQANNIYVYCGNSPIIFFDITGQYYIVKRNIHGICCGDSRCQFTCNRKTSEYYEVVSEKWYHYASETTISMVVPCGTVVNFMLEMLIGVEGGNSASTASDMMSGVVFYQAGLLDDKVLKGAYKVLDTSLTIKSTYSHFEIMKMDQIASELLLRNGYSLTSNDSKALEKMMEKAYGFIEANSTYFFEKFDGVNTFFEIDKDIMSSSNKVKVKETYSDKYKFEITRYRNSCDLNFDIESAYSDYKTVVYGSEERTKIINNGFKEHLGEYK